jgi:WD repeat and SOF domain-containing protein 1
VLEFQGKHAFRGVDHHWCRSTFATAGAAVELWDHGRSEPISSFNWGSDSVVAVRFNPVGGGGWGSERQWPGAAGS